MRTIEIDGYVFILQLVRFTQWDIAGHPRFRSITTPYYKGAHGIIIVFDRTSQESFDHVETWLHEIYQYAVQNVAKMLVGAKSDLEVVVDSDTARLKAKRLGMNYVETSAKLDFQVNSAFTTMARTILNPAMTQVETESRGQALSVKLLTCFLEKRISDYWV